MKRISLRISDELAEELDAYRGDVPMNTAISRTLQEVITKAKSDAEFAREFNFGQFFRSYLSLPERTQ